MKLFVAVAATLLFAALAQSPGRACTFIVPVIEHFPCPPRKPGATPPALAGILAQAKADWRANQFRPECLAQMLDNQLGQSEERLLLMLGERDPILRMLAVETLARHAALSEHALAGLLQAIADADALVARSALPHAIALTLAREPAAQARLARLDSVHKELLATALLKDVHAHADATLALARAYPPLVERMVARLGSGEGDEQYATSAVLAALPALHAQYLPALCAATQRSAERTLPFLASALARGGDACAHQAWIRVLNMDPARPISCGPPGPVSVLSPMDPWADASRGLRALGEPGMHALLVAAGSDPKPGVIWAISQFNGQDVAAADAALMADVMVKFPDVDKEARRLPWHLNRPILEALLERSMNNIGDQRYALALGKITPAQWRAHDAAGPGGVGGRLLAASIDGYPRERALALELLGARYFDLEAPANVLASVRRALDDGNPGVARGALVALTSFRGSGAQARAMLRGSKMIKGKDTSALVLALTSENPQVSGAAAVALGVLRVRDAGMALRTVAELQLTHNRLLAQLALQEIAGPAQDDRLPWARHVTPRR